MTKAGVARYRRENPGSKLKTAVTGKVKKGSKAANRRKSYCARSAGQMKKFPKAAADPKNHKYSPAAGLESLRQIIAKTTKGSGVSFIENQINWHHKVPSEDEYGRAISELNEKLNSYE